MGVAVQPVAAAREVGKSATVQANHNLVAPSVSLGSGSPRGRSSRLICSRVPAPRWALGGLVSFVDAVAVGRTWAEARSNVMIPRLTITTLNPNG